MNAPTEHPIAPVRGLPRWVPVRTLGERHRQRAQQHLLALGDADRQRRFGHLASDERIQNYVAQIDFQRDEVFGVFDRRLQLVALAHLAFDIDSAEFGVSVLAHKRGLGLGGRLFEHAVMHARNRGVNTLLIHMARDNTAMLAIVRKAGAQCSFQGGEGMARLQLPADTLGSQIEQMLGHQAAELDYRLKRQALRLAALAPGR
jgi:GNAT superfamily N-acetyltransferase